MNTWTANDYVSRSSVDTGITAATTDAELVTLATEWVADALDDGGITIELDDMIAELESIRANA